MTTFDIKVIPQPEFKRIISSNIDQIQKLCLLADMCRLNAFSMVKKAGSGHLGSSFSAMEIFTYLYFHEMNTVKVGIDDNNRDIFFSSKGHDNPGQYSVLNAAGILSTDKILMLRRFGGLDGHPDVGIPGIEVNSGSLGMGISKARGFAIAKRLNGYDGRIFVLLGDGELHEGQIWESLQSTAHDKISSIHVIVDRNKFQSAKQVDDIIGVEDLVEKFKAFGWHVERGDGHDLNLLKDVFIRFREIKDKPKILVADTVKGKGISFMEVPRALEIGKGYYRWHAGAPNDNFYEEGFNELLDKINAQIKSNKLESVQLEVVEKREKNRQTLKAVAEKVVNAYEQALVEIGTKNDKVVVLDADLTDECGLRSFEQKFPERFVECGIAEQDMVSTAGALARQGFLPIVNSFGVFLASRSNEQVYNNTTEKTRIIYVCHFSGLIPAGPGKSHQSLRDISLFGALPNFTIIEPCNSVETKEALNWCVNNAKANCMMRLAIGPSPRAIELPTDYSFQPGKGTVLREGKDGAIFSYGPVMLNEALLASEALERKGYQLKVVDMPWLNIVDKEWLVNISDDIKNIFVLDNHSVYGGLGTLLTEKFAGYISQTSGIKTVVKYGIDGHPACGAPAEVFKFHRLDGESLAGRILKVST